jgi:hypothetical protein
MRPFFPVPGRAPWFLAALLVLASGVRPATAAQPDQGSTLPAGSRLDSRELARHIDRVIDQRLRAEQVAPSPRADDAEFLRRVYLDLTGRIPPAAKVRAFLADKDPNKRARLIDELLASPAYGGHQADLWRALLLPRTSDNRRFLLLYPALTRWLEEGFNDNKPWDQLVRELLTASGQTDQNPAVVYFLANPTADKVTDNVTRLFLGVQLQCAQCHNHPFTGWKQTEYWGMAAFFTRVRLSGRPRPAGGRGPLLTVREDGKGRRPPLPDSAKVVPAKFLQGEEPPLRRGQPARPVLARWLTSPDNPFFSKAMVNRTWAQLFGRGIVNPVDDMHEANAPSHPELLADLAGQLAAHDFDLKYLIRAICNSEAYQRTSKPHGNNAEASPALFSHMAVKVLTPEQLFDSLTQALGTPNRPAAQLRRAAQAKRRPVNLRAAFAAFFQVEDGADPTEYQAGIPQALRLMNGPLLNNFPMLLPLLRSGKSPRQVIEDLYLATLSRPPTTSELARLTAHVRRQRTQPRQAYADVLWALINSSEFAMNH